jgi:hypothetical protein
MLKLYGKAIEGQEPVWLDGSSMRFLPIKGAAIKSAKTKDVVKKRLAYHIWLKANEISIETNMVNIHQTIDSFDGKTFSDIILATMSNLDLNTRIFNHFNRLWNMDPTKATWVLSVRKQCEDEATTFIRNCHDYLFDKYGQEIEKFFSNERSSNTWAEVVNSKKITSEDNDNWFEDDDEMDDLVKKGLIDPAFIQFLTEQDIETDRQSVASWGTGATAYTEMVEHRDNSSTVSSAITQESALEVQQEILQKKEKVIELLKEKGVTAQYLADIGNNKSPFKLVFSGIHLSTWKPDKEIFYIMALLESNKKPTQNDDDDE